MRVGRKVYANHPIEKPSKPCDGGRKVCLTIFAKILFHLRNLNQ